MSGKAAGARWESFAEARDPELRRQLIEENLGLATFAARRYANRGESLDDLVQVASLALVKAVDRFDPGRGVQFSTFATQTIEGELKRHFRDKGWALRAPRRLQELAALLASTREELTHALGRSPTVPELARAARASEEEVLEALEAAQAYLTASLEQRVTPDGEELGALLGTPDPGFVEAEARAVLEPLLSGLSERDRRILSLRFVHGCTQAEIARQTGLSQMHVSRLLGRALDALRRAAAAA